jgi:hypothetical protein
MVPNAILISPLAAFTATIYAKAAEGSSGVREDETRAGVQACAKCVRAPTRFRARRKPRKRAAAKNPWRERKRRITSEMECA